MVSEWDEHEALLKIADLKKEIAKLRAKLKAAEEEIVRLRSMKSSFRTTKEGK